MKLISFTFYSGKKKINLKVKECKSVWSKFSGLMFRKTSPPLLFVFNKEKNLSIHSLFCAPFIAVWLDENKKTTKISSVKNIGFNFSGKGKFLLEIPMNDVNYSRMTKMLRVSDGNKKAKKRKV
jgi:uncharacterized membrane protein (UPF0127 family)